MRSLLTELVRQLPSWQFDVGVLRGVGSLPPAIAAPNVRTAPARLSDRAYRTLVSHGLPAPFDLATGLGRNDVVVFPDFVVWPLARRAPVVAFVYDLSFVRHAEQADARHAAYLTREVERTMRRATSVVTISHAVREEILERYDIAPERVRCVYPAVDRKLFRPRAESDVTAAKQRLGLPERFLLATGTLEPRKNLVAAVDAYDRLPADLRNDVGLVLVGKVGWRAEATMAAVERPRSTGRVVHLGFASDEDLSLLYSGAEALLFPSFYEGFGLPMVEAMAAETPVIAADRPVLAEVSGGAARLVDADDAAAYALAISQVLGDPIEQRRLVDAGRARVDDFSWAESAATLAGVLRDAAG
ncbi:glycosyltransferase family 1 protein [Acidothermaceae bacterium B102]|nr:glycosyltransferase family 1 protein [Acidothermaceae bacterium B102]